MASSGGIFSRFKTKTNTVSSSEGRDRSLSAPTSAMPSLSSRSPSPKPPPIKTEGGNPKLILTSDAADSPVPLPSPGSLHRSLSFVGNDDDGQERSRPANLQTGNGEIRRDDLATPTAAYPTATFGSMPHEELREMDNRRPTLSQKSSKSSLGHKLKSKASQQSLGSKASGRSRRGSVASSDGGSGTVPPVPPVPALPPAAASLPGMENRTAVPNGYGSNVYLAPAPDTDAVSIRSNMSSSPPKKKKAGVWGRSSARRGTTSSIAGALAASGMSLAHVTNAPPSPPPKTAGSSMGRRGSVTSSGNPPRSSIDSVLRSHVRGLSLTSHPDVGVHHESDDDSDGIYDSPDALSFDDDDIPITGFAVASSRRNADFHELFPGVVESDYLIEDYGCAMQRDILVQGRLYISENHMCFHANIFGWVTNITIPFSEVVSLEKKMTAFVIPNAIQVTTRNAKHTFASFITRDTSYDVLHNIWRLSQPHDTLSNAGSYLGNDQGSMVSGYTGPEVLPDVPDSGLASTTSASTRKKHPPTACACSKEGIHYAEVMMDAVYPGTPEQIYNLIFASAFIKDFMLNDQKLFDLQMSDWAPQKEGSHLLARNMSYIKPLNNSFGPKQTKCEISDETLHVDFDDYIVTMTTTRTPGVPSGGVFSVKTRTCITWAGPATTKVVVTSVVEWTGRSFIKAMIEKGAQDGQRTYHRDLETAIRSYILKYKSEFFPEGVEDESEEVEALANLPLNPIVPGSDQPGDVTLSAEEIKKARQLETEAKGLQWALDTVMGTWDVASRSTKGAIEILTELFETSSRSTLWGLIVFALVVSNIWTMMSLRNERKRDEVTRKRLGLTRNQPVPEVADVGSEALRVLLEGVISAVGQAPPAVEADVSVPLTPREELRAIEASLVQLETRMVRLKSHLGDLVITQDPSISTPSIQPLESLD